MFPRVHHPFLLWEGCNQAAKSRYNTMLAQLLPRHIFSPCVVDWNMLNHMGCGEVIDEMLTIKLCVASIDEEIFTSEAWTKAFNIKDLYERMGSMEIRQGAIERMDYRQSYHWDRYHGVFKHMAGMYNIPMDGTYNPPGYDQHQYQQYYQQYLPQQQQPGDDDDE
ncbi:hypothetical protein Tco_1134925 [Tanacetum coccineum]